MKALFAILACYCILLSTPLLAQIERETAIVPTQFTVVKNGLPTTQGVDTWHNDAGVIILEADASTHELQANLSEILANHPANTYLLLQFDVRWKNDTASNGRSDAAVCTIMLDGTPYFTLTTPLLWKWAAGQARNGAVVNMVSFKEGQVHQVSLMIPVSENSASNGLLTLQVQPEEKATAGANDDFYFSNIKVKTGVSSVVATVR